MVPKYHEKYLCIKKHDWHFARKALPVRMGAKKLRPSLEAAASLKLEVRTAAAIRIELMIAMALLSNLVPH